MRGREHSHQHERSYYWVRYLADSHWHSSFARAGGSTGPEAGRPSCVSTFLRFCGRTASALRGGSHCAERSCGREHERTHEMRTRAEWDVIARPADLHVLRSAFRDLRFEGAAGSRSGRRRSGVVQHVSFELRTSNFRVEVQRFGRFAADMYTRVLSDMARRPLYQRASSCRLAQSNRLYTARQWILYTRLRGGGAPRS